jgi:hypothetical protein
MVVDLVLNKSKTLTLEDEALHQNHPFSHKSSVIFVLPTEHLIIKADDDPLQLLSRMQTQYIMATQAQGHCATSNRPKYPARVETKIHPDRVSFNKLRYLPVCGACSQN